MNVIQSELSSSALLFLSGVSRLASAPAWLVLLANTAQFADQLDKFIRPALLCLHLGTALPPRAAIASAPPLLWHCGRGSGCRSCVFYCRSLEELQSRSCHSPSDQPDRPSRSHRTKVSYSVCTYSHLLLTIACFSHGHAVGSEVNEGTSMPGAPRLFAWICRLPYFREPVLRKLWKSHPRPPTVREQRCGQFCQISKLFFGVSSSPYGVHGRGLTVGPQCSEN
jgi:hypothetical protein